MEYRRGRIPGLADPNAASLTLLDIMMESGPFALWPADDSSGPPKDVSGNSRDLSLKSGSNSYNTIASKRCVDLSKGVWDGPSLAANTAFTLEAWVYPTGSKPAGNADADGAIIGNWFSSGTMLYQLSTTSSLPFRGYAQSAYISTTTAQKFNEWQHVALTWDTSTLRLYFNGVQEASASAAAVGGGALMVSGYGANNRKFGGYAHHIAVYTKVLSAVDIERRYVVGSA